MDDAVTMRRITAYHEAISRLLGTEFSSIARIVRVHSADWWAFNRRLHDQRPGNFVQEKCADFEGHLFGRV